MTPVPKIKYLTNKDLLAAIHESKLTFCEFEHKRHKDYHIIVNNLGTVSMDMLEAARAKMLLDATAEAKKTKTAAAELTLDDFPLKHVVVRLMTFDHIPFNPAKYDRAKTVAEKHVRCQFPPFQHFVWENEAWRCVGRSHWKNGEFSLNHGRVTNRLGAMWIKLVERYGHRGNWRGYSYLDEMRAQALVQLSQVGLQFDESKGNNPFSYYTTCVSTSFLKILTAEKKSQNIRDDLLIMNNQMPSHTRQTEDQIKQRAINDAPLDAATSEDTPSQLGQADQ